MPKKKKVKKTKKAKKVKKVKIKNSVKSVAKPIEKKNSIPGQDEKPEIKKIKKQPTEKRIYNLKDLLLVIIPDENPTVEPGIYYYLDPEVLGTT